MQQTAWGENLGFSLHLHRLIGGLLCGWGSCTFRCQVEEEKYDRFSPNSGDPDSSARSRLEENGTDLGPNNCGETDEKGWIHQGTVILEAKWKRFDAGVDQ
eukprot:scaffold8397_cov90-Cylindrotheca_fusiformis.AAC.3